jgi:hypothetical protein
MTAFLLAGYFSITLRHRPKQKSTFKPLSWYETSYKDAHINRQNSETAIIRTVLKEINDQLKAKHRMS